MGYSAANGDQKHVALVVNFYPGEINVARYSSILGEYLSLKIYPVYQKILASVTLNQIQLMFCWLMIFPYFIQVPVAIKVLIMFGIK